MNKKRESGFDVRRCFVENRLIKSMLMVVALALLSLSCNIASIGAAPTPQRPPVQQIIDNLAECVFKNDDPDHQFPSVVNGRCEYIPILSTPLP